MFEKEAVEVACPKCDHKGEENVGRLKTDGYTCPNCGDTRDAAEFARDIKQVRGRDREIEEALCPREEDR